MYVLIFSILATAWSELGNNKFPTNIVVQVIQQITTVYTTQVRKKKEKKKVAHTIIMSGGGSVGESFYFFRRLDRTGFPLLHFHWFLRLDCCRPRSIAIIYSFLFFPFGFFFILFLVHWRTYTHRKMTRVARLSAVCVCVFGMIRSRTVPVSSRWDLSKKRRKKRELFVTEILIDWASRTHTAHTAVNWTVRVLSPRRRRKKDTQKGEGGI